MASTEITKIEYCAESQSNCHNVLVFAVFVLALVLAFVVLMNHEIRSVMVIDVHYVYRGSSLNCHRLVQNNPCLTATLCRF